MLQITKPSLIFLAILTSTVTSLAWCSYAQALLSSLDVAEAVKVLGGEALLLILALVLYLTSVCYKPANEKVGFVLEKTFLAFATLCISSYFTLAYYGWESLPF